MKDPHNKLLEEAAEQMLDAKARREKLISLNRVEVVLGIMVAVISVAGAAGSWFVMPYRVAQAEKTLDKQQGEIDEVKKQETDTHELLVRIEERVKAVQQAMAVQKREGKQQP